MEKLFLICNAHIDPVWQWEWEEGVGTVISTFSAAADFCEEYDSFVFNHNESLLYEWVEEYAPVLFKRIQKLVQQGKWHIMGGWYLQPDCNMSSGESIVRQIIKGQQYFQEKFNVRPTVAVNFDSFGHSRGLVQILQNAGYRGYICCRPLENIPKRDFIWQGYNESQLLLHRAVDGYCTLMGDAGTRIEHYLEYFKDEKCVLLLWGVGNHGGGPSRKDLDDILEIQKKYPQIKITHSNLEEYFDYLETQKESLPVCNQDLNYTMQGCYTSQIRIKQNHMKLENELFLTEKMLTNTNLPYPYAELDRAEKDLLFSEFHDILPGSSVEGAEKASLRLLDHGLEELSKLKHRAFMKLSGGQIRAVAGEYPILVYNPHPFTVEIDVECEMMLSNQNYSEEFYFEPRVMSGEHILPSQLEKEASNIPIDWRKKVVFHATLQPLQMNRFSCFMDKKPIPPKKSFGLTRDYLFTCPHKTVKINYKTGLIDRYEVNGERLLVNDSLKLNVIQGYCDPWGFTYNEYTTKIGEFVLMDKDSLPEILGQDSLKTSVNVIEDGAVRTVVEAYFKYNHSYIVARYSLSKFNSQIGVQYKVYNNEKDKIFRLHLCSELEDLKFFGKVCYGVKEFERNSQEVVAQDWVCLANEKTAVTIINFGNYGCRSNGKDMDLTLMQSPAYTAHPIGDRKVIPEDRFMARIDQGERDFEFVIDGGEREEMLNNADNRSMICHQRPVSLNYFPTGEGEKVLPILNLDNRHISISCLKKNQDGAMILRLFNSTFEQQKANVTVWNLQKCIQLNPLEFITLKIDNREIKAINILGE